VKGSEMDHHARRRTKAAIMKIIMRCPPPRTPSHASNSTRIIRLTLSTLSLSSSHRPLPLGTAGAPAEVSSSHNIRLLHPSTSLPPLPPVHRPPYKAMARNEEKAQAMLNKWLTMKKDLATGTS